MTFGIKYAKNYKYWFKFLKVVNIKHLAVFGDTIYLYYSDS